MSILFTSMFFLGLLVLVYLVIGLFIAIQVQDDDHPLKFIVITLLWPLLASNTVLNLYREMMKEAEKL